MTGNIRRAIVCLAMMYGTLFADVVSRIVEPVAGGCRITLSWELSGNVESDLVIEERFASGWSVDDSTVPFASLDASWFSGGVARFAVKPSLLSTSGSVTFTVLSGNGGGVGSVSGDWKMYLDGVLKKGTVTGDTKLPVVADKSATSETGTPDGSVDAETSGAGQVMKSVAVKSFRLAGGRNIELSYAALESAGVLVVEGCEGLGKTWMEVKRLSVGSGEGTVSLGLSEVKGCRFFRLKLLTEVE